MFKDLLKETKVVNEMLLSPDSDLRDMVTALVARSNDEKLGKFWSDHHAYWSKEVVMNYDPGTHVVTLTVGDDSVSLKVPRVKAL